MQDESFGAAVESCGDNERQWPNKQLPPSSGGPGCILHLSMELFMRAFHTWLLTIHKLINLILA